MNYNPSHPTAKVVADNLAWVYGRRTEEAKHDPDKRSFVKSVNKKYLDPDTISDFNTEFEFLKPAFECPVVLNYFNYFSKEERSSKGVKANEELYPSFEHALIASKLNDVEKRNHIRGIVTIQEVKKYVSKEKKSLNSNWKDMCLKIAEDLLRDKFGIV